MESKFVLYIWRANNTTNMASINFRTKGRNKQDSSVSRSSDYMKLLFTLSKLDLIEEQTQTNFPEELTPVKMFALAPLGTTA